MLFHLNILSAQLKIATFESFYCNLYLPYLAFLYFVKV